MDVIDLIDAQLLKLACPENSTLELAAWVDPIKLACRRFGIDKVREIAAFLAQGGHESGGFLHLEENLNYSGERMCQVWPHRYAVNPKEKPPRPNALAISLQHNPQALANNVYANRLGNGGPASGDGWRCRGYGLFQLTGRHNHQAFADAFGIEFEEVPNYIRTKAGAAMSAAWFFKVNGLEDLAMTPGVDDETRRINGGLVGLDDRKRRFTAVVNELLRKGA
jgi:putative chitinase